MARNTPVHLLLKLLAWCSRNEHLSRRRAVAWIAAQLCRHSPEFRESCPRYLSSSFFLTHSSIFERLLTREQYLTLERGFFTERLLGHKGTSSHT